VAVVALFVWLVVGVEGCGVGFFQWSELAELPRRRRHPALREAPPEKLKDKKIKTIQRHTSALCGIHVVRSHPLSTESDQLSEGGMWGDQTT